MSTSLHSKFAEAIDGFLDRIESRQSDFFTHYEEKDAALKASDAKRLLAFAAHEEQLCHELRASALERNQILQAARGGRLPTDSLKDLCESLTDAPANELRRQRIERVGTNAARLRQKTWSHWVVAQRSYAQYSALIDLIAHRGRQAPTYSAGEGEDGRSEGSLMDASA
ncbi:flagellar export chaperone FlgN [Stratiformator vulcanicus]|nr:flagellar export chaperone FlgN [Stratiformator vulcanicus]